MKNTCQSRVDQVDRSVIDGKRRFFFFLFIKALRLFVADT